ncbi:MAG: ATP-binding protein [Calditrichaeota bacterium]|nr:ATP-binding protein [Calditrichota bacterium]
MTNKNKKYQLKIPIETANLEIIRDFVARIAQNMGFSEENIHRIELAVDEASTNVIKHAYKGAGNKDKFIMVEVTVHKDRLEIDVIDTGTGFDPEEIRTPEMDEYLKKMKRGGLGLYLIKTLMDKVEYKFKPGIRNRVRMTKYKNAV